MEHPFSAYEGNNPYVFVCYAHDDSDVVYPELAWLADHGVRIWYDEGISVGSAWREKIAATLSRAAGVLFYRSAHSIQSPHCQNEVNFAYEAGRPIVIVALDAAPMTPGMQLTLGGIQAIEAHRIPTAVRRKALTKALAANCTQSIFDPQAELATSEAPPIPVLVSDVEVANLDHSPVEAHALEQLLEIGLGKLAQVVVHERSMLQAVHGGAATSLESGTAIETARRDSIDYVIRPLLTRSGPGYQLKLILLDSRSTSVISEYTPPEISKREIGRAAVKAGAKLVIRAFGIPELDALDDELVSTESLSCAAAHARGRRHQHSGQYHESISAFAQALDHDPQFGMAHVGLAVSYWMKEDHVRARTHYQKAFGLFDHMDSREQLRAKASYYAFTNDHQQAIRELTELLREFPYDQMALTHLPVEHGDQRDIGRAIELTERAMEIYPNHRMNRLNHGIYLMYGSQFEASRALLLELLADGEISAFQPHVCLALDWLCVGDVEAAQDVYERLVAQDTDSSVVGFLGLADIEGYFGRFDRALEILTSNHDALYASNLRKRFLAQLIGYAARADLSDVGCQYLEASLFEAEPHTLFVLGDSLVRLGVLARAETVAAHLERNVAQNDRLHGALLRARLELASDQPLRALDIVRDQTDRLDTWYGRLLLAETYLALDANIEALGEYERCVARSGEALSITLDELPTAHFLRDAKEGLTLARQRL